MSLCIRIALMSVADMQNYGDTLFPFVARRELRRRMRNVEFRFFTPTDQVIEGERFYSYSRENLNNFSPNVILVIGGEVIHEFEIIWERAYKNVKGKIRSGKVSDIFFDWLDYPCAFKGWFSVGAIGLPSGKANEYIGMLDYVGVRGVLSKKILEDMVLQRNDRRVRIVPDIGWIFLRNIEALNNDLSLSIPKLERYMICNVNTTTIDKDDADKVRMAIIDFARNSGFQVVETVQMVGRHESLFRDDDNVIRLGHLNLRSQLKLLEGCSLYFGSSLHYAITALSNHHPAGIIHKKALTKFQDMFGHLMITDKWFSDNWGDSTAILQSLRNEENDDLLAKYVDFVQGCLDSRLDELCEMIERKCMFGYV